MNTKPILLALFAVAGCNAETQTVKAGSEVNRTGTEVAKNFMGELEFTVKNREGQTISAHCGSDNGFVYVDTLRPVASPPPLHGVYGQFIIDGRRAIRTELGWGSQPPSAWTAHDRNPVKPLVLDLIAAKTVKFVGPDHYAAGPPVAWTIDISERNRDLLKRSCIK